MLDAEGRVRRAHHQPPRRPVASGRPRGAARERAPLPLARRVVADRHLPARRRRATAPTSTSGGARSPACPPKRPWGFGWREIIHPDDLWHVRPGRAAQPDPRRAPAARVPRAATRRRRSAGSRCARRMLHDDDGEPIGAIGAHRGHHRAQAVPARHAPPDRDLRGHRRPGRHRQPDGRADLPQRRGQAVPRRRRATPSPQPARGRRPCPASVLERIAGRDPADRRRARARGRASSRSTGPRAGSCPVWAQLLRHPTPRTSTSTTRSSARPERAQGVRAPARPPGHPRPAHRPAQPRAADRPPRQRARPGPAPPAGGWPCCSSTSTTSRSSTTASATAWATACSSPSANAWPWPCARATPWPGSAATSSSCCARTCSTRPTRSPWPSASTAPSSGRFVIDDTEVFVGVSIGIACPDDVDVDPETLIRDADAAMYRAKDRGRARWELFDNAMRASAVDRLDIETALRRALERRELRVFYQPIIDLTHGHDRRRRGAAALGAPRAWPAQPRRLHHGGRGDRAHRAHRRLGARPGLPAGAALAGRGPGACPAARVGEPLGSPARPRQSLVDDVASVLAETGIDPSLVELEITESVLMDDVEMSQETLGQLHALGVKLAVDDFGTGYSSLSYLRRFPVDLLKVDRSFVDGARRAPGDSAIVTAIVTLAHTLGLMRGGRGRRDGRAAGRAAPARLRPGPGLPHGPSRHRPRHRRAAPLRRTLVAAHPAPIGRRFGVAIAPTTRYIVSRIADRSLRVS